MAPVVHDPSNLFPPYRGYVHALEVPAGSRLLFISGLNGFEQDGSTMPESFEDQAELIWKTLIDWNVNYEKGIIVARRGAK